MKVTGQMFRDMCVSAANALDNEKTLINELNVFPVPDGDTGSNMSLSMNAVRSLENFDGTISDCSKRVADLILRAARGNSGAILSLFFRGFAKSLAGLTEADSDDLAAAFAYGTREAYSAVANPSEGTILTVMRMCAEKGVKATKAGRFRGEPGELFGYLFKIAQDALAKTPEQLPILRQSGVVDAGGSGFVTVVLGMLGALNEEPIKLKNTNVGAASAISKAGEAFSFRYPYCTECMVEKDEAHRGETTAAALREELAAMGDSLVFMEDETLVKLHVHTDHPGAVLEKAMTYGTFSMVKVENMRNQHTELIEKEQHDRAPYGFVAVAAGDGVAAAFRDMGVSETVRGGQTMNPSTDDLLGAIERVSADVVFLFPNNKNIFLVAKEAAELCRDTRVLVVPTTHFTEGFSAMMNFDPEADADANFETMKVAAAGVTTLSLTHAVRDANVADLTVREGEVLGLYNNKVKTAAPDIMGALVPLLDAVENAQFVNLWCGADADPQITADVETLLAARYPAAERLTLDGAQPLYDYVISFE